MPLMREITQNDISSPFGMRFHPILKVDKMHQGVDIKCRYELCHSYQRGYIHRIDYNSSAGNYMFIQHEGYKTYYAHLSEVHVDKGQQVLRKQRIGKTGATGGATGPHLHFGILLDNGKWVDPMLFAKYQKLFVDVPNLDKKKYEAIYVPDENKTYVEVRDLLQDLGHEVSWSPDGTVIDIKKCSGLSEKEMLELTRYQLTLKHEITGLEQLLNKIKK